MGGHCNEGCKLGRLRVPRQSPSTKDSLVALPVVPKVIRTVSHFKGGEGSSDWSCTLDYKVADDAQIAENEERVIGLAVAEAWKALFDEPLTSTEVGVYFHEDVSLLSVDAIWLDGISAGQEVNTSYLNIDGLGSDPLPALIAMCCTKRTGVRGRSYRGRFYLGSLSTDALQLDGTINGDFRSKVSIWGDQVLLTLDVDTPLAYDATLVVVGNPPGGPVATPVTQISVDDYWDTQRRRAA